MIKKSKKTREIQARKKILSKKWLNWTKTGLIFWLKSGRFYRGDFVVFLLDSDCSVFCERYKSVTISFAWLSLKEPEIPLQCYSNVFRCCQVEKIIHGNRFRFKKTHRSHNFVSTFSKKKKTKNEEKIEISKLKNYDF